MKKINAVLIDHSFESNRYIKKSFEGHEFITSVKDFSNGEEAIGYLVNETASYDVIILDPLLPGLDGETLLEELNEKGIKKKVVIISNYIDEDLMCKRKNYNIINFFIKPVSPKSLERRIRNCFQTNSLLITGDSNIDLIICNVLHDLGIPSNLKGYNYIKEAILIKYLDSNSVVYITKDLYPRIAEKYNTKAVNVERNIRHAIEVGTLRCDYGFMTELFKSTTQEEKAKPTNNEFISTITERLKIDRNLA